MTAPAHLLYLHGVGSGDAEGVWWSQLDESLRQAGYPDLSETTVAAPQYPNGLRGVDDDVPLPEVVVPPLRGDAVTRHALAYQRRRTALEVMLGSDDDADRAFIPKQALPAAAKLRYFAQLQNYRDEERIRAWVLQRVIDHAPTSGRLVIVGHSLGSIIAADLVRRLPPEVEVTAVVSLGSPLGHVPLLPDGLAKLMKQPPSNLAWWVNFWRSSDPVALVRTPSRSFRWILDRRISTPLEFPGKQAHAAAQYLADPLVARAIGFGVFGARSRALVPVPPGIDRKLEGREAFAILGLRYAHLIAQELDGDRRLRFLEALREVQALTVEQVRFSSGEFTPRAVTRLGVDLTDEESVPPVPPLPPLEAEHDVIRYLVTLAFSNVIAPFEIDVEDSDVERAMCRLTLEMGLGERFGTRVLEAVEQAEKVLKGSKHRFRWAAVGAGALALVAATGGLALAAAPGAVGAAALTSALAAFGPGGMVGGLLTAGTLATAGGSSIAVGLSMQSTSAAAVEEVVAAQLAMAILRRDQQWSEDESIVDGLDALEHELSARLAKLEPISDDSAPSVKDLRRKLTVVRRALDHLESEPKGEIDAPS